MPPPISLTRVAFPSKHPLTVSNHALILQALHGWGDPEQLTDSEALELKRLCVRWFKLKRSTPLQARVWKDAVVFSMHDKSAEYAVIVQDTDPLLYRVDRGNRLIPAEHGELEYLKHVVDMCFEMMG